jgi:hypothetical protein
MRRAVRTVRLNVTDLYRIVADKDEAAWTVEALLEAVVDAELQGLESISLFYSADPLDATPFPHLRSRLHVAAGTSLSSVTRVILECNACPYSLGTLQYLLCSLPCLEELSRFRIEFTPDTAAPDLGPTQLALGRVSICGADLSMSARVEVLTTLSCVRASDVSNRNDAVLLKHGCNACTYTDRVHDRDLLSAGAAPPFSVCVVIGSVSTGAGTALPLSSPPHASTGAHAPTTLRTTRSPTLMTRRHAICHTPQLTAPRGANGSASHHAAGPSQPGGRKKTGVARYHHPSANCAPVVATQSALLNLSAYLVRADEISLSAGHVRTEIGTRGAAESCIARKSKL